eukprot:TRINITY_DN14499_c0_g1_i1.p1 TRINITY_DN14499_c0_g1~~TRINITY_DN14499_c0_g1_i1.p1  ORF type:complete len:524 (+),score=90.17 TRINITY_DN14499_c0_g1_i1:84-1655(+)
MGTAASAAAAGSAAPAASLELAATVVVYLAVAFSSLAFLGVLFKRLRKPRAPAEDRGCADRGSADRGSADRGSADRGSALALPGPGAPEDRGSADTPRSSSSSSSSSSLFSGLCSGLSSRLSSASAAELAHVAASLEKLRAAPALRSRPLRTDCVGGDPGPVYICGFGLERVLVAPVCADQTSGLLTDAYGHQNCIATLDACGAVSFHEKHLIDGGWRSRTAPLPWPAAAIDGCGERVVAVARGGARVCVLSWDGGPPHEVQGLPEGDPVVLCGEEDSVAVVMTRSGEAYGWHNRGPARRVRALCGLGLRRFVRTYRPNMVAETQRGGLIYWNDSRPEQCCEFPQSKAGRVTFPLRSLAGAPFTMVAADAAGRLWCAWDFPSRMEVEEGTWFPASGRCARVAVCGMYVVALTVEGHLWYTQKDKTCRSISAGNPGLPRGLRPCQGRGLETFGPRLGTNCVLIRDPSWMRYRRCMLLLFAAGLQDLLPGGDMPRASLAPFIVHDEDWVWAEGRPCGPWPRGETE